MVVNRSLIGQQASLSSTDTPPTLLATTAPPNRLRGSGDIAGEAIISELSSSSTSSPRRNIAATSSSTSTPRRNIAPNDGRLSRTRRVNMDFGMNSSPYLPPSTGNSRNSGRLNVESMSNQFNSIAASLSELSRHQTVRPPHLISDDLIRSIEKREALVNTGGNPLIIEALDQKITGMNDEMEYSRRVSQRMFADFPTSFSDGNSIPSLFTSENDDSSRSENVPPQRPCVRQRRSAD